MRIPIKMKMFAMVAVVLLGVMVTVLWNTNQVFYEDKKAFVVQLTNKISSGVARLLSDRLKNYQNKMAIFTANYESLDAARLADPNLNSVLFSQYPEFMGISLVQTGGKPKWSVLNQQTSAKNWGSGFSSTLLGQIRYNEISPGQIHLQRLSDPTGRSIFVVSIQVVLENKQVSYVVGFLETTLLGDLVADYKGDLNTVFVVDSAGYSFAHPKIELVGSLLKEHPVVAELMTEKRNSGAGESEDLSGEKVIHSYLRLENSNAYVVVTTPKGKAFEAANELFRTLIVVGLGILLIGLVIAILFSSLITRSIEKLKAISSEIGKGNFNVQVDVKSQDEMGDLAKSFQLMSQGLRERDEQLDASKQALVQSEKMSAFGQLSAGIAHEVKNPLAGILGHAQLAKGKAGDNADMMKHLDVIEKETRRTREIIDNLMRFSRSEKLELIPIDIHDAVKRACDLVDHQLSLMDVKIEKHINPAPMIQGNSNQIQQVLLNLMMNAGHAMEKSPEKKLIISLDDIPKEKIVRIKIRDTGHGIPKEIQAKIFEPFFTTKPAGKGTGLGLSVSIGIVKDHKGKIYIESEVGKGTTFFIDLPVPDGAQVPVGQTAENTAAPISHPKPQPVAEAPSEPIATHTVAPPPVLSLPSELPKAPLSKTISGIPAVPSITVTPTVPKLPPPVTATSVNIVKPAKEEADDFEILDTPIRKPVTAVVPGMPSVPRDEFAVTIRKPKLKG